ncbi:TetR/AcrR family transcriptional regulator [Sandaracinobacteroides saxicola]|uniref:TetR/AcrR family transcriptional regulator n=1 Tax=Sandaracinobacteroides saxicola TaxID=2759707 RepID=A0A7G5IDW8_9SPHN|nr:TetR/AcrR family transcriptional regulator [Sandaracinobacteroides saxicola]QMW21560.1 TetR/AcrR family transcriptional regulator [Sandaracinobacteroides saxicola]
MATPPKTSPASDRARHRPNKKEQGAATREKLLRATVEVIRVNGFAATSTTMIVEQLGVTRGALNHHFADKEELILAVGKLLLDDGIAQLGAGINAEAPVGEKLARYADSVLRLYLSGDMLVWIDILMTARRDRTSMRRMRDFFNEMDARSYDIWMRLFARDCPDKARLVAARDVLFNFAAGMAINRIFVKHDGYWRDLLAFLEQMLLDGLDRPAPTDWPRDRGWVDQFPSSRPC